MEIELISAIVSGVTNQSEVRAKLLFRFQQENAGKVGSACVKVSVIGWEKYTSFVNQS